MKTSYKVVVTAVILIFAFLFQNVLSPVMSTQVALTQAQDSVSSYTNGAFVRILKEYFWLVYPLIVAAMFWREIKSLFKRS